MCDKFARSSSGIIVRGDKMEKIEHTRPRPRKVFVHNPTKRRYDYVDYTGSFKQGEVEICEQTMLLEIMGYIKFIERKKCNEGRFAN